MRWSKPGEGEQRVIARFLWWPKELTCGDDASKEQTRWLEVAYIQQTRRGGFWRNICWMRSPKEIEAAERAKISTHLAK